MEIKNYNNTPSFKGYDARILKGLLVTDKAAAEALKKLAPKTELDVFLPSIASKSIKKERFTLSQSNELMWAQDYLTVLNHKVKAVLYDNTRDFLKRVLRATGDGMQRDFGFMPVKSAPHLRGGNFFLCNNKGRNEMLICEDKLLYPKEMFESIFNVEKIHTIPKLDYHLDLFIRPLDNGNVLVADNEKTKAALKTGIEKINKYITDNAPKEKELEELKEVVNQIESQLQNLEITEKHAPYKPVETTPKVVESLEQAGYNPIRVPANYYYLYILKDKQKEKQILNKFNDSLKLFEQISQGYTKEEQAIVQQYMKLEEFKLQNDKYLGADFVNKYENNFINAIVAKRKDDGKIVYITNAPLFDKTLGITAEIEQKTGFSTKNMFLESVAPYIEKQNIHFVDENTTKRLFNYFGGIHCSAAEIV